MARRLRARFLRLTGVSLLALRRLDGSSAAILNYHRVLDHSTVERESVEEGMYVTPATFRSHLNWLVSRFQVLPLREIVDRVRHRRSLPERACAITFDDGWRDNLTHALPALEALALPSTIFVVTNRVGTTGAFWPEEVSRIMRDWPSERQRVAARQLGVAAGADPTYSVIEWLKDVPRTVRLEALDVLRSRSDVPPERPGRVLLNWEELERMAAGGVDIEAHGATHDMLTGLTTEDAFAELSGSRSTLLERGYGRGGLFAYPAGRHDRIVQALVAKAGFSAAVTIERGLVRADSEPYALPRLMLHEGMSATEDDFLMRVPGWA